MDRTQDVILGVLGTQWERSRPGGVESYLESIKRSGFLGRKIMLCWDIHTNTRGYLLGHGFELVDLPTPPEAFFKARMRVCWEYLKEHYQEFRYIFWLDVKDLVLQGNPSDWMEANIGDAKIIASSECVPIEHEETNQLWARTILGESRYQEIKGEVVINGGTWAGESEAMTEVFRQVHEGCTTYTGGYPPCQIWINYVLHTSLKHMTHVPRWSEGFAACLHPCWSPWRVPCWPHMLDPHPVLDLKNCVLHAGTTPNPKNPMIVFNPLWGNNPNVSIADRPLQMSGTSDPLAGIECVQNPSGKIFTIVHGYDRDWDIKAMFEFKYRSGLDFSLDAFNKWSLEECKKWASCIPVKRRGFRRPKHEGVVGGSQLPQPGRVFKRHL